MARPPSMMMPETKRSAPVPTDPQLAWLDKELTRIDGELAPPARSPGSQAPPSTVVEAQKQHDDAAKQLAAAQAALQERLLQVTPAHPDAIAAQQKVDAARAQLLV